MYSVNYEKDILITEYLGLQSKIKNNLNLYNSSYK